MGYSCSALAHTTLEAVLAVSRCDDSQNTYTHRGNKYFIDINRRSQPSDGAITGSVFRFVSDTQAARAGSFKIDGDGTIIRWAACPVKWRNFKTYFRSLSDRIFQGGYFAVIGDEKTEQEYNTLVPFALTLKKLGL